MSVRDDPRRISEKDWSKTVKATLEQFGYAVNHVFPMKTSDGSWRTGTTAKGWPDWMAVRGRYILALELKGFSAAGVGTPFKPGQIEWLEKFAGIPTGRAWVLRPTDPFDEIVQMIRFPQDAPRRYGYTPPVSCP